MRQRGRRTDVYEVWDSTGRLLYVGISQNAFRRIFQHRTEHAPWWNAAEQVSIKQYATNRDARRVEAATILQHQPTGNVRQESSALRGTIAGLPEPITDEGQFCITQWKGATAWAGSK